MILNVFLLPADFFHNNFLGDFFWGEKIRNTRVLNSFDLDPGTRLQRLADNHIAG